MRNDMYKVIVERPRKGKAWTPKGARRRFDEDGPSRAGIRAGLGARHLNENLSPLKRFLQKQVGRPWDKVWSEIASNIDRRNTVQLHIYAHVDDFIAVEVEWKNGAWINRREPGRFHYWRDLTLRQPLYVDPRTGLIRRNVDYESWRRRAREKAEARAVEVARFRRPLGDGRWHMKIEDIWYEVRLAPMPHAQIAERSKGHEALVALHGSPGVYAESKRQLSKREIEEFDLPR